MLVLSRRQKESIVIGDNIEVTIISFHNTCVRLGISAPKEITIHRKEIYRKIQAEKKGQFASNAQAEEISKIKSQNAKLRDSLSEGVF